MSANSFGNYFKITTFGESHGAGLGVVIDGCPAGLDFDQKLLINDLERRRPGNHGGVNQDVVSQRKETDQPQILSGVFEGKTLGTPIAILFQNIDQKSKDYDQIKTSPRAGHADDVWNEKFGISDHRGGGRSSGRETVARVAAGAIAKMLIKKLSPETEIIAYPSRVGPIELNLENQKQDEIRSLLSQAQEAGESYGGTVSIRMKGVKPSLGQPVFHKLKADLAFALMSIGATSAFELGDGLKVATAKGSEFHADNKYAGIRGGITTGEDIEVKLHFKPTSSILDVAKKGRHDPCIVLRATVVAEAMCAIVIADHLLWQKTDKL